MKKSYRGKHRRSAEDQAKLNAKIDLERRQSGSFNRNAVFNTTAFYAGFNNSGTYSETIYDVVSHNRFTKKGDFKTTTPYSHTVYSRKGSSFLGGNVSVTPIPNPNRSEYTRLCGRSGSMPSAQWWGGYANTSTLRANLMSLSQTTLLRKIRGEAPTWDILTDAVELKETISTLRSSAQEVKSLLSAVIRKDVSGIARSLGIKATSKRSMRRLHEYTYGLGPQGVPVHLYTFADDHGSIRCIDAASNLWMRYRYGFMPMIYSMQDALIALAGPARNRDYVITSQVTIPDGLFWQDRSIGVPFSPDGYAICDILVSTAAYGSIRKKAYYNFTEDLLNRLNPNTIIAMTKTAWELVPYSWVSDWFISISDYLNLLELPSLLSKASVNVSEKGKTRVTEVVSNVRSFYAPLAKVGFTPVSPWNGVYVAECDYFERSVGTLNIPDISPSQAWFNWKRGLDSATLLWQQNKTTHSRRIRVR